jgi:thiosulfate dehydrogenase
MRLAPCLLLLAACTSNEEAAVLPALEHGRFLFADRSASPAADNPFTCATCHRAETDPGDDRLLPGAPLAGAPERSSYWGGAELDLLAAINHCRTLFMGAAVPWTAEDEQAKVMYLFLTSLAPGDPEPRAFSVTAAAQDVPAGDPLQGEPIYRRACHACHGAAFTAEGRLWPTIPLLPGEAVAELETLGFDATEVRVGFVEKVRHGPFLGLEGRMPLYAREALDDQQLGALLAYLGRYP